MYTAEDHAFALCAYKESPYLEECLMSLLEQTLPTEVVICTATPNDSIRTIAQKYDIRLYVNESEPGIARDWNYAISMADSPLVTVAHQDDRYEKDYAKRMLSAVNSVETPLLYFTNYGEIRNGAYVDDNNLLQVKRRMLAPFRRKVFANSRFARRRMLSFGSAICCPSVTLVTGNIQLPAFVEGYKSDLDWQAWEKISRLKGSFLYDPEILMRHRIHENSETTALIENNTRSAEDLAMFEMFWPRCIAKVINSVYSNSQKSNG